MSKTDFPIPTHDASNRPAEDRACPTRRGPRPTSTLPPTLGRPLLVLVVDDPADSLAQVLTMHGFPARSVATCAATLTAVAADPPDVVILHLLLIPVDGWEAARRAWAGRDPDGRRPVLVAVTEGGSDEDRRRAAEVGVDLVLIAPVEPAVVVGVLRRFARALSPGQEPPRTIDAS
jgi:DNA-binding response OmpR family regulator